jgi:hypothetical protein
MEKRVVECSRCMENAEGAQCYSCGVGRNWTSHSAMENRLLEDHCLQYSFEFTSAALEVMALAYIETRTEYLTIHMITDLKAQINKTTRPHLAPAGHLVLKTEFIPRFGYVVSNAAWLYTIGKSSRRCTTEGLTVCCLAVSFCASKPCQTRSQNAEMIEGKKSCLSPITAAGAGALGLVLSF